VLNDLVAGRPGDRLFACACPRQPSGQHAVRAESGVPFPCLSQFGKLEAEGLAGIRLVPLAGYTAPAACQAPEPPTPSLGPVVAQPTATGPTTATVAVQPPPGTGAA